MRPCLQGAAMNVVIRLEEERDRQALWRVNRAAFEADCEASLVDALREGGHVEVSLVAECDGQIVGHILSWPFSDMPSSTHASGSLQNSPGLSARFSRAKRGWRWSLCRMDCGVLKAELSIRRHSASSSKQRPLSVQWSSSYFVAAFWTSGRSASSPAGSSSQYRGRTGRRRPA